MARKGWGQWAYELWSSCGYVGSLPYFKALLGEFQAWWYVVALYYELQFLVKTVYPCIERLTIILRPL
jgi:hypothetical protein